MPKPHSKAAKHRRSNEIIIVFLFLWDFSASQEKNPEQGDFSRKYDGDNSCFLLFLHLFLCFFAEGVLKCVGSFWKCFLTHIDFCPFRYVSLLPVCICWWYSQLSLLLLYVHWCYSQFFVLVLRHLQGIVLFLSSCWISVLPLLCTCLGLQIFPAHTKPMQCSASLIFFLGCFSAFLTIKHQTKHGLLSKAFLN